MLLLRRIRNVRQVLGSTGSTAPLLGALLVAMAAGVIAVVSMRWAQPTVPVVVVVRDVPPGASLSAGDVTVRTLPPVAVPSDAIRKPSDAEGLRVRTGLVAGDTVRRAHMATDGSNLAARLSHLGTDTGGEWRAVALPGDIVGGLLGRLVMGDQVDIESVVTVMAERGSTRMAIHVTQAIVLDTEKPMNSDKGWLILAIPAEDVPRISLALAEGRITLSARPTEAGDVRRPPTRIDDVTTLGGDGSAR